MIKLKCLGAGQEVGRSGFLIQTDDENILFDYGLKLHPKYLGKTDSKKIDSERYTEQPLQIKEYLDAVILSHAHLDHSGNIPFLFKKDEPNLFLTEGTLDLSNILWLDTLKIAKYDKKEPFFQKEQIATAYDSAFYLDLKKTTEISENVKLTFYDAGHIVGSVISVLEMQGKKIMYTGDFRASKSILFPGYDRNLPKVDYLIMESTYGDTSHEAREEKEKKIINSVLESIEKNGKVILAAFAIERTQELIALMHKYKIEAPIYVDGMGIKVAKVFLDYPEYFNDYKEFKNAINRIEFISNYKVRKKVLKSNKAAIIITTAGMLEGGPIIQYIKEFGEDPSTKIILTGYQVKGTNGHRLETTGKLYIDGELFQPKCKVEHVSLSAHPDEKELLELVDLVKPKKIITVHGDSDVILEFKKTLENKGYEVFNPKVGDTIKLLWIDFALNVERKLKKRKWLIISVLIVTLKIMI